MDPLLIGGIIVVILLLCMETGSSKRTFSQMRTPRIQIVRLTKNRPAVKEMITEGSLGPTPTRKHDIRDDQEGIYKRGSTEHYKNKTNAMWQGLPSQAKRDDETGLSLDAITSEHLTPFRGRKTNSPVGRPRMRDALFSHV